MVQACNCGFVIYEVYILKSKYCYDYNQDKQLVPTYVGRDHIFTTPSSETVATSAAVGCITRLLVASWCASTAARRVSPCARLMDMGTVAAAVPLPLPLPLPPLLAAPSTESSGRIEST